MPNVSEDRPEHKQESAQERRATHFNPPGAGKDLVETVYNPASGQLCYCIWTGKGKPYETSVYAPWNIKYTPPTDRHGLLSRRTVQFPSCAAEYGTDAALDKAIVQFIRCYADMPEFWEEVALAYIKMTWAADRFDSLGYLRFLGDFQSGKTRMAQTVASLCYRIITVSGAVSVAALYRVIDQFRGTIFVDEADYCGDLWSELIKIFNSGYKRDMNVLRCNADNEPVPFDCFGPKILTARERFLDEATESRCITLEITARAIRKDIERQLPRKFHEEALGLRNQLLMWRFRNLVSIVPDQSGLLDLQPRHTEIAIPLAAVSRSTPGFQWELGQLLSGSARRAAHRHPYAFIIEAIIVLIGPHEGARLRIKTVAEKANELREAQEPRGKIAFDNRHELLTYQDAGDLIRRLGFEPVRYSDGLSFDVSLEKARELSARYRPPD